MKKPSKTPLLSIKRSVYFVDSPICIRCLDELRRQQVIDEKVYDRKLMDDAVKRLAWDELQKNIVVDGDPMIDRRTGEVLSPEVNFTYWKRKLKPIL